MKRLLTHPRGRAARWIALLVALAFLLPLLLLGLVGWWLP